MATSALSRISPALVRSFLIASGGGAGLYAYYNGMHADDVLEKVNKFRLSLKAVGFKNASFSGVLGMLSDDFDPLITLGVLQLCEMTRDVEMLDFLWLPKNRLSLVEVVQYISSRDRASGDRLFAVLQRAPTYADLISVVEGAHLNKACLYDFGNLD